MYSRVLHAKPIGTNNGPTIVALNKISPSLWPVMFAGLVSRIMGIVALYLAERGSTIGTLERLLGCRSVFGAITTQYFLRKRTLTAMSAGMSIVALWALSPIGGQASLRMLGTNQNTTATVALLRYLSTGPGATLFQFDKLNVDGHRPGNELYIASLIAPIAIKRSPHDLWGNVKIPDMATLERRHTPGADGWLPIENSSLIDIEDYTGLVGIPIVGLSAGNATFRIETSYISVQCNNMSQIRGPREVDATRSELDDFAEDIGGVIWTKMRNLSYTPGLARHRSYPFNNALGSATDASRERYRTFFLDTNLPVPDFGARVDAFCGLVNASANADASVTKKRDIIFGSLAAKPKFDGNSIVNIARCPLSRTSIEAEITCQKSDCRTAKLRRSLIDHRPDSVSALEWGMIFTQLVAELPESFASQYGASSPTEYFLHNSQQTVVPPVRTSFFPQDFRDISEVELSVFSRRLSIVLNTYYQLMVSPSGYTDSDTTGIPLSEIPTGMNASIWGELVSNPLLDADQLLPSNWSTTNKTFYDLGKIFFEPLEILPDLRYITLATNATVEYTTGVYKCNFAWFGVAIGASFLLLILGAVALVLEWNTIAPDVFGYVSSMVLENRYFRFAQPSTARDGWDRSRKLYDVSARLADVRGDEEVGHIVLTHGVHCSPLRKDRLYV
ncbi:hypothetical protein B0O99DRAFT_598534 [Bisporella sp. PMI_857]|nr:hypothetical protein B0O99DRAFT_598534 [Bisporella sp. PMI_857]